MRTTLAGIDIDAISVGGVQTCLQLPGFGITFDIGRCPLSSVARNTVLLTHTHMDHIGGIAYHASLRQLWGMKRAKYVIAPENAPRLAELFSVFSSLTHEEIPHQIIPLGVGEELQLSRGVLVKPFRSYHRVPCQGYAVYRQKKKLLSKYQHLTGPEIGRLKRAGTQIERAVKTLEVAFPGDTTIEVLEREAMVREARLLLIEVTFVCDKISVKKARSTGHIHLNEVAERADLFENEAILFTHFSSRYENEQILEALDKKLPSTLRERVTPLLYEKR